MTEKLKTLKDLTHIECACGSGKQIIYDKVLTEQLRYEAIKRIKNLCDSKAKAINSNHGMGCVCSTNPNLTIHAQNLAVKLAFMEFFNITKEEISNE